MEKLILLTALIPIAALAYFVYYKDRNKPEPIGQLAKAFLFGVLSVFVSLCISLPLGYLGLYQEEPTGLIECVRSAFLSAAIPEEIAKFVMLWLLLRKNKYFDEHMDGIVYAAYVSLGFAALENILYLFDADDFLQVGLMRAIFAVPGHFCYGVLMGYYYSLVRFSPELRERSKKLVLLVPILLHGIYDALLFSLPAVPVIVSVAFFLLFIVFCVMMWRYTTHRVNEHLQRDYEEDRVGTEE
jgi:RsiW-degrading membrane proteinase PrsW (M82 family)